MCLSGLHNLHIQVRSRSWRCHARCRWSSAWSFPYGAYAVGEVTPVKDYDRSTKEVPVQATDPDTGLPVWSVDVVDADPEAKKATRMIVGQDRGKGAAGAARRLPEGVPFRPVEFDKMTATAYIEESGDFGGSPGRCGPAGSGARPAVREPSSVAVEVANDKAVA